MQPVAQLAAPRKRTVLQLMVMGLQVPVEVELVGEVKVAKRNKILINSHSSAIYSAPN